MQQIDFKELTNKILDCTDGGYNIIVAMYPQANTRNHFKLREEKTASCSMKKINNTYIVKDFGSSEKAKNAIQLYAEYNGLEYYQALFQLAQQYQIPTGSSTTKPNTAKFKKIDLSEWDKEQEFDETNFCFETKEFTEFELKTLGPFVDEKTCQKYHLFSLKWYAVKKEGKIIIAESTETYPMFIFCFTDNGKRFYKILQPKSAEKKYRFFWKGTKPKDFIGGLSVVNAEYEKRVKAHEESLTDESLEKIELEKVDMLFLCSGERDALNMASLGYFVIWLNSETADLNGYQLKNIYSKVDELYNIPDLDETGYREGFDTAMKFLEVKTLWLPDWLKRKKDWRGNPRKDLCDFFEVFRHLNKVQVGQKIKSLIRKSYPMRFWDVGYNSKNQLTYTYNNVHGLNFLYRNGFCRLNVKEDKDGYKFVHINEHIVREIKSIEVKDFVYDFLEKRNIDTPIRNMMYNTTRLSDNQIATLPRVELDFKTYTKTTQMFYFSNQFWQISSKGINVFTKNTQRKYVWQQQIIDQKVEDLYTKKIDNRSIKLENPYFSINKVDGHYKIDVLEKNCEFLNFLINISRIHWQKELTEDFNSEKEQATYWRENLFNISGGRLDEESKLEQQAHLVNKLFTIGYLLHNYKSSTKAWAVYAIENDVIDDNESHGGSGKSLLLKALQIILNQKYIEARNNRIWEDKHLFEGVTKYTGYVLFDDANKDFKFDNLYSSITGPMNVNPKNNQPYTIPFSETPKFAISSNYSLRKSDPSTQRRILFTAVSDYYHAESEFHSKKRDPKDDFGHELFRDWTDEQFNKCFNLFAQCVQFYLQVDEKINPPMNKIHLRNLQASMGPTFIDWANDYLNNNLDVEFSKKEAHDNLRSEKSALRNITTTDFNNMVKSWCEFNGHIFMPKSVTNSSGRIQRKDGQGKRVDFLFIQKGVDIIDDALNIKPNKEIDTDEIDF